eukprot:CAMPEP_0182438740 /NCGR_PEP_ID=MMETSP1167-20130531/85985_1 /TAXON_ID=2988 /ORGANISM="Mallomonas Sp, Strain CCMP3275" /LENGTH=429 /DNA_ID=CAMNT_0024632241 /DNA_START=415 /DNA_END=1704 /DNA_ORIENTATION=+
MIRQWREIVISLNIYSVMIHPDKLPTVTSLENTKLTSDYRIIREEEEDRSTSVSSRELDQTDLTTNHNHHTPTPTITAAPTPTVDPTPEESELPEEKNTSFFSSLGLGKIHVAVEDVVMSGLLGVLAALVGIVIVLQRTPEATAEDRRLLDVSVRTSDDSAHSTVSSNPLGPLRTRTPKRISVERDTSRTRSKFTEMTSVTKKEDSDSSDEETGGTDKKGGKKGSGGDGPTASDPEVRIRPITPRRMGPPPAGSGAGSVVGTSTSTGPVKDSNQSSSAWASETAFGDGLTDRSATADSVPAALPRWSDLNKDTKDSFAFPLSSSTQSRPTDPSRVFKSPARVRPVPDSSFSIPQSNQLNFSDTVAAAALAVQEYTTELPSFASLSAARLQPRDTTVTAPDPFFSRDEEGEHDHSDQKSGGDAPDFSGTM